MCACGVCEVVGEQAGGRVIARPCHTYAICHADPGVVGATARPGQAGTSLLWIGSLCRRRKCFLFLFLSLSFPFLCFAFPSICPFFFVLLLFALPFLFHAPPLFSPQWWWLIVLANVTGRIMRLIELCTYRMGLGERNSPEGEVRSAESGMRRVECGESQSGEEEGLDCLDWKRPLLYFHLTAPLALTN